MERKQCLEKLEGTFCRFRVLLLLNGVFFCIDFLVSSIVCGSTEYVQNISGCFCQMKVLKHA